MKAINHPRESRSLYGATGDAPQENCGDTVVTPKGLEAAELPGASSSSAGRCGRGGTR